ncbi:glycosyltransferase [Chloroflexales bacterium ZM16-3]|nr:glycosyltransferase [Chloroflexales bacterium ZM16-3]
MAVSTPLLSVTVLNYNYAHFLPTCLDSILGQSFRDFELILINDKSTDNSLAVIQPYLADPRVRLIDHQKNKGFVGSLLEGVDLSRGTYISVISADDWVVDPSAFAKQIAALEENPDVVFAFGNYGFYADEKRCTSVRNPSAESYIRSGREVFQQMVIDRAPQHSGTMIRRTAYDKLGGYDRNMRYAVDGQMWLGLCHLGKVAYIHDVLYAYRMHTTNMTKNSQAIERSIREVLQILDWSFGMLPPADRRSLNWLYNKAVRWTLVEYATKATFEENNLQLGWSYFWMAFRIRPWPTLAQNMLITLLLCTLLGVRGYKSLEQLKARVNPQTRSRLRNETHHLPVETR